MCAQQNTQRLEEKVAYLTKEVNAAINSLELAADLGHFRSSLNKLESPLPILVETAEKISSLIPFKAMAFYLVNEEDADIFQAHCQPPSMGQDIEHELNTLIDDKTLAWVLGIDKPVFVTDSKNQLLLLHAISTASRTRGVFIGLPLQSKKEILGVSISLASNIFLAAANMLESYELYCYIKRINTKLENNVHKLENSEKELLLHRNKLEDDVAQRTEDLTRTNERLKTEIAQRYRTEMELVNERDFTATVLETLGALVMVLKPDGRIVRFNRACEYATGYTSQEVLGRYFWDFFFPQHAQETIAAWMQKITPKNFPYSFEKWWITKEGAKRIITWSNSMIMDPAHPECMQYFVATGIDVTVKRSAEAALRESEARFKAIFTNSGVGISLRDINDNYIDCNPAFAALLGYAPHEITCLTAAQVIYSNDTAKYKKAEQLVLSGAQDSKTFDVRYVRKSGTVIWTHTTLSLVRSRRNTPRYFIAMVENNTQAKEMEHALRDAEKTYRNIFENAVEGIFLADPEGVIIQANPAMARMLGYASSTKMISFMQKHATRVYVLEAAFNGLTKNLVEHGTVSGFELQMLRKDGRKIWVSVSARGAKSKNNELTHIEGLAEDITDRKITEMHLQKQATHDGLTDVPNRYLFMERFEQMLAQAKRLKHNFSLMYIDLDDFKAINDDHGHPVGDLVLQEVASRLKLRVRKSDTLARIGGDEFTLLLYDVSNRKNMELLAQGIIDELRKPYAPEGLHCVIGASIGIASFPVDGVDPQELLKKADTAMYRAKQTGRNTYAFYSPQQNT